MEGAAREFLFCSRGVRRGGRVFCLKSAFSRVFLLLAMTGNNRGHHPANWKNKDKCLVGLSSVGEHKCQSQCLFRLMERARTSTVCGPLISEINNLVRSGRRTSEEVNEFYLSVRKHETQYTCG